MGAIAVLKNKYRSWLAHQFAARDVPDKFTKMSKCAEIISELKENVILFCWKKGGLIQGEDPVVPQDCENVEESQDEERVLNRVIEKMGECDIEDEDNLVELIEIAEEIAEEPPRKKQKQAKMTSFFVKKLNKSQKPFSHFAIF